MRMRRQLIVAAAVVFATLAVGVNVYASTRADQRSQQLDREMPVASVLDRGIFDTPRVTEPSNDSTVPGLSGQSGLPGDPDEPCAPPAERPGDTDDGTVRSLSNHGRTLSSLVAGIGHRDCVDGPPGAVVSEHARPDVDAEGPPRSDRAEERSSSTHPSPPPSKGRSEDKNGGGQDR